MSFGLSSESYVEYPALINNLVFYVFSGIFCAMYRHCLKNIRGWFEHQSHKPLVLRGARQVGKSTLVRLFAEQQEIELIELNFERNPEYAELFTTKDPKSILPSMRGIKIRI